MNYSMIAYITGWVLKVEAAFLILPCIVALIYREEDVRAFLLSILICGGTGLILTRKRPRSTMFNIKEGYVTVALCWIVMSIMGALPFLFSGTITNPVDALFETVSGFTTTGASILTDVEVVSKCVLFWRSFTHWIGGMGVLVFLLTVLPMVGGSHMNLMKAESPGPSVSRLVPKVRSTAKILYEIYIAMTILQVILLLIGRMPLFDALTITFGTAGTGGFAILNDSLASYSTYIQVVVTIFMILFGVNFNVYFLILAKHVIQALKIEELWGYLGVIAAAILIITWDLRGIYDSIPEAMQQAAFQVASIITTTGYASTDFNLWPEVSRTVLVILMFIGACAGSTGGGIKVSRLIILCKTIRREMVQITHPKSVMKIKMDGKTVEDEVIQSTHVFMIAYLIIFTVSVLIVGIDGHDLITNFTAVAATFNNVGPGLELVGPVSNFSLFSDPVTLVLTFDMLAGRLEIFPLLILFMRSTWKKF
ncbi:MAG TPA: TrkH family potassium uptake protein [Candidatus Lachnoclostridium stercoravium]|uniref:TrkH family potassium uptake protein n=1 Tax=Candidatus Lachnoclostridium stercoravium TaxID=2838633 RepID=A0A9D2HKI5_9FIRM|nr:TrkH family potassium uptake protein [Candidatus Lachnoclostridium stercoravium]